MIFTVWSLLEHHKAAKRLLWIIHTSHIWSDIITLLGKIFMLLEKWSLTGSLEAAAATIAPILLEEKLPVVSM